MDETTDQLEITNQTGNIAPTENGHGIDKEQFTDWMTDFGRGVDESVDKQAPLLDLCAIFIADMTWLRDTVRTAGPSQNALRVFVKTMYANAEGFLWVVKQLMANTRASEFTPPLTDDDIAFLNDKRRKTDSSTGEATETNDKIALSDNIKKTKKIMCRAKGCETFDIDLGSTAGQKFFRGAKVRDRLTHPKHPEEMQVSYDEMHEVKEGVEWLTTSLGNFITMYRSARKQDLDDWFNSRVEEAQQLGVDEAVITDFIKRVRPSYTPPKLPFAYSARTVRRPEKATRRRK